MQPNSVTSKEVINKLDAFKNLKSIDNNNIDLNKNLALGTQRLAPKTINKLGLSESQLISKSKLEMFSAVKKNKINDEEVAKAFTRINEKKNVEGGPVNKLMAGLSGKQDNLSFNELSEKLMNKKTENNDKNSTNSNLNYNINSKKEEVINEGILEEKDVHDKDINILIKTCQNKNSIEKVCKLDEKQLLKRTDSLKNNSRKGSQRSIEFVSN